MTESMREAFEEFARNRFGVLCDTNMIDGMYCSDLMQFGWLSYQAASTQPQQWIKCSDRFPEINKQVLTYCVEYPSDGFELEERFGDDDWRMNYSASHWMELPEPPKE